MGWKSSYGIMGRVACTLIAASYVYGASEFCMHTYGGFTRVSRGGMFAL
jgi:hypothetical protein